MRHLLALLVLAAPAFLQAAAPPTSAPAVPVAVPAASGISATLRPGDVFDMKLTGMPSELIQDIANIQYNIGPDGTVNIPLIGKTRASGLTATQLEDAIQAKYIADKIFTRPTVIINVQQGQRSITLSGGVRQPGRQVWTADMTLGAAIGNAGGMGDFSSGKGIRLIRESKVFGTYNFKEISKDPAKDPKLLPGDQVIIPE
jgi:protein involved in polysaccharide export with SLBB domain